MFHGNRIWDVVYLITDAHGINDVPETNGDLGYSLDGLSLRPLPEVRQNRKRKYCTSRTRMMY